MLRALRDEMCFICHHKSLNQNGKKILHCHWVVTNVWGGVLWMQNAVIVLRQIKLHLHAPGELLSSFATITEYLSFIDYCTLEAQGPFYPQSESV